MPTLGLSMIVKDEAGIVLDCLRSIVDYLDYWVVHDTGSADNTAQIINDFFTERSIPGELHHVRWKNFGHNRNLALECAKGKTDYTILLDADFIADIKDPDFKQKLSFPAYYIHYKGEYDHPQMLLIENKHNWAYIGATHEHLTMIEQKFIVVMDTQNMLMVEHTKRGSSHNSKSLRDIQLLLDDIEEQNKERNDGNGSNDEGSGSSGERNDEGNGGNGSNEERNDEDKTGKSRISRSHYYIAQSYMQLRDWDKAIEYYQKVVAESQWEEEVYHAQYQVANCYRFMERSFNYCMAEFLKAYVLRPLSKKIKPKPILRFIWE
jgi:glycosyltransferase involved in cell wall biosynthesis